MKAPGGYYHLLSAANDLPSLADANAQFSLTNPKIEGFRWRTAWGIIQPTSSTAFDWSTIDAALDAMAPTGKFMGISIRAGAQDIGGTDKPVPDWAFLSPTVDKFTLDPLNDSSQGYMPYPWQAEYLAKWHTFITEFGRIYDPNPLVKYIVMTGWQQKVESTVAKTADEETRLNTRAVSDGFTNLADALTSAYQTIVGYFAEAFPNTSIMIADAKPFPSDPSGNTGTRTAFRNYPNDTQPMHGGFMFTALSAHVAPFAATPPPVTYPHIFQCVSPSSQLATFYGGSIPSPTPVAPQPIDDISKTGIERGGQAIEIYGPDAALAANQGSLDSNRILLIPFTPQTVEPPPPDPTPLPPGMPPATVITSGVPRIIPCRVGTHARNIILARKRTATALPPQIPPGPVENLFVDTPHQPSSGVGTATWKSPSGSDPDKITYKAFVTGGPGTVTIISNVPI